MKSYAEGIPLELRYCDVPRCENWFKVLDTSKQKTCCLPCREKLTGEPVTPHTRSSRNAKRAGRPKGSKNKQVA